MARREPPPREVLGCRRLQLAIRRQQYPSLDRRRCRHGPRTSRNLFGSIVQTNVQLEDWSGYDTGVNTPKEVINGARTFLCTTSHPAAGHLLPGHLGLAKGRPRSVQAHGERWPDQLRQHGREHRRPGAGHAASVARRLDEPERSGRSTRSPRSTPDAPEPRRSWRPQGRRQRSSPATTGYQDANGTWKYDAKAPTRARSARPSRAPCPSGRTTPSSASAPASRCPTSGPSSAGALATDGRSARTRNPAMRWDIHDEMVDENGNAVDLPVAAPVAGGRSDPTHDAVVNIAACPFSGPLNVERRRLVHADPRLEQQPRSRSPCRATCPTAGPFDPNYAEQTLLPDGHLDAGDAPMPAARIDFAIAANTNPLTSTRRCRLARQRPQQGGGLQPGRQRRQQEVAGNLFAPFYSQYIPATSRDPFGYASGVDGALITNNFPGFLSTGQRTDWTDVSRSVDARPHRRRNVPPARRHRTATPPVERQTAAVYTDEHGEARIGYLPGGSTGTTSTSTPSTPTPNDSNRGCDLHGRRRCSAPRTSR